MCQKIHIKNKEIGFKDYIILDDYSKNTVSVFYKNNKNKINKHTFRLDILEK